MKGKVNCTCGWSWNKSDSSAKDMYICHECGRDNSNNMKNGGWLDNYNDSQASAPEGMKGDGYSNVGRNYSPAWGGQFEEGGEIPMAQNGRATRADSLNVYNNTRAIDDYFKKQRYTKQKVTDTKRHKESEKHAKSWVDEAQKNLKAAKKQPLIPGLVTQASKNNNIAEAKGFLKSAQKSLFKTKDEVNPKKYLENLEESRELFDTKGKDVGAYIDKQNNLVEGKPSAEEFYGPIDENTFNQREQAQGFLDLRSPMPLYDKRITPQYLSVYKSPEAIESEELGEKLRNAKTAKERAEIEKQLKDIKYTDNVEMYDYDPLAVMPFDILEKEHPELIPERIKKYGIEGVPTSVIQQHPEWVTTPMTDPAQRQPEKPLIPLKPTGIQNDFNIEATPLPAIRPEAQIPKSYKLRTQRYTMNGPVEMDHLGYYNNQEASLEQLMKIQAEADAYNANIQKKYVDDLSDYNQIIQDRGKDRAGKLKMEVVATPNYQMGGNVYPVNYFPQAQEGKRVNVSNYNTKLIKKEKDLIKKYVTPAQQRAQEIAVAQGINTGLHNGPLDAIRHSSSSAATSSILPSWANFIPGVAPLNILAANIAGAAHELNAPNNSLKEHASDLYNNFIGSVVGALPMSEKKKHELLIQAQKNNVLSNLGDKTPLNKKPAIDLQQKVQKLLKLPQLPKRETGGSIPGATGSMYARVGAPSNGPYAKKTMASAQNGVDMYDNPMLARRVDNTNIDRSYYDPRLNTMNIGSDYNMWHDQETGELLTGDDLKYHQDKLLAHENYHAIQHSEDRDNYDIAHDTDNAQWAQMQKRPELMSTNAVWNNFYNRSDIENQQDYQDMINYFPESRILNEDLLFDKVLDGARYNNPSNAEGEAKFYEDTGVGFRNGGWLDGYDNNIPKAQRGSNIKRTDDTSKAVKRSFEITEKPANWIEEYFNKALSAITPDYKSVEDREKLFKRYRPVDYPNVASAFNGLIKDSQLPEKDIKGNLNVAEEAWRKALNLPVKEKYIIPSAYKPTKYTESNSKYYTLNNIIDKEKILAEAKKLQIKPGQKINLESMAPYIKEEFMDIDKFSNIDPLQKFQINMDPKGKYISIYDKYDFDFAPANKIITPYEFYDRFYLNDEDIPKAKLIKGNKKKHKQGGIIKDDRGQWDHPGEITRISGGNITMKRDPKTGKALTEPILGIADTGEEQWMYPGEDYNFEGANYVTEYPKGKKPRMAKNGLRQEQKGLQNLDNLLNFTNYNKPQPGGWLSKYE